MVRPKNYRFISPIHGEVYFKPKGIPLRNLDEMVLTLDEFESLRLADLQGLYHEEAAKIMGISRATFGRILQTARVKVADALVNGKALRVEGGVVQIGDTRVFMCLDCDHQWEEPFGTGRPDSCPACQSLHFVRSETSEKSGPGYKGRGAGKRFQGRGQRKKKFKQGRNQ